ncbi:MAG: hypothetical protein ACI4HI_00975 [Lachnospiraceae bacterium]
MQQKRTTMKNYCFVKVVLAFCTIMFLSIFIMPHQKVEAANWKEQERDVWIKGSQKICLEDNKLYKVSAKGKKTLLSSWNKKEYDSDNEEYLKILTIRDNKVVVSLSSLYRTSKVYSVDLTKKKRKTIAKNCSPSEIKGKYIYANEFKVSDTGAYKMWIWKIQKDGSLKRIKKLGNYIQCVRFFDGKIFYSYYPTESQTKMSVYCSNYDGSHAKKLFTVSTKEEYGQILLQEVGKKEITAWSEGKRYIYNRKTKKVKTIKLG